MMNNRCEGCENQFGRLLDLCLCEGQEGRPHPDLDDCNFWRAKWGLPLLTRNGDLVEIGEPQDKWNVSQRSRGLGDTIAKITTKLGVKPCGGCKGRQSFLNRAFPFAYARTEASPQFVTTDQLMRDVKILASRLPLDTARIIGVSRSGLCASSMVAMLLHLPISIVRQSKGDLIDAGNGWRLTGNTGRGEKCVVIDDTVMTGNSLKHIMPIVRREFPDSTSAAVYVNPAARQKPDIWVHDLPWPHLLEWNLFNSIISPGMAVDFDGVLCHDCRPEDDDDGDRYLKFINHAPLLYPVRRVEIPLIVTARLEKYRAPTMEWLSRRGIAVKSLVMSPCETLAQRRREDIAAFKASHFAAFIRQHHQIKPPVFVESDPRQAERIAKLSGGLVVCPAAGRCFP